MPRELVESKAGIGVLIVDPLGNIATVQELETKRGTHKISGMRSIPMETVEPGESFEHAWRRLFREELHLGANYPIPSLHELPRICRVQLRPSVWLHTYQINVPEALPLNLGQAATEVSDPLWIAQHQVLNSPRHNFDFRPGTREAIISGRYFSNRSNLPKGLIYHTTADQIPDHIFDELEAISKANPSAYLLSA